MDLRQQLTGGRKLALAAGAGLAGAFLWERTHPSACPYALRFFVQVPRPGITRRRLREILEPRPGERLLEVGPGTGYYALPVAEWIAPDGRLDVLDVQREMLDHLMRGAAARGLSGIEPVAGDARRLPYPDASFDGAYLVTVLGEIPDGDAALRELRRVVRPGGRVVFGETPIDPHVVTLPALRRRAAAAGFRYERHSGSVLAYFARFTPA